MTWKILLVEDDADSRDIVAAICTEEGYAVTAAESVDEALVLLATHTFDAILADGFARFDRGQSEAERLLGVAAGTPIIAHTGWPIDVAAARRRGFAALVQKPTDLRKLLDALAQATAG